MGPTATGTEQGGQAVAAADPSRRAGWSALGGMAGAIGAASCCVVPFVLFMLGISGAWIGDLTALEPYKPAFAAMSLGFIGYGAWRIRRSSAAVCAVGSWCGDPHAQRWAKLGLGTATVLLVIALVFPYMAAWYLGG